MSSLVVEAQGILADSQCDVTALAWLEIHLLEGLQLLHGAIHSGFLVLDIELYGLCACSIAGIGDLDGEGNLLVGSQLLLVGSQSFHLEGGIAQAMTEGEGWLDAFLVGPASGRQVPG